MKYQVWNDEKKLTAKEGDVFFHIIEDGNDVCLLMVDHNGEVIKDSHILTLDGDFQVIVTADHVDPVVPLKTDYIRKPLINTAQEIDKYIHTCQEHEFMKHMKGEMEKKIEGHQKTETPVH